MKIEVEAKLILTIPNPQLDEFGAYFALAAEQHINNVAAVFIMPKTKTKVGVRIHVGSKGTKVIR